MSDKIKLRISPAVARFAAPGVDSGTKLKGLDAAGGMPPADQVLLIFCLLKDRDEIVKGAASSAFSVLTEETLLTFLQQPEIHPAVLDAIAREFSQNRRIVAALLGCETIAQPTSVFLTQIVDATNSGELDSDSMPEKDIFGSFDEGADALDEEEVPSGEEEYLAENAPEDEEYLSKYKMVQLMGISEKIKMALSGDKEWRSILIKDANKLVSGSVIKNPRITDGEILTIIKVGVQNDEIMRLICANKEWIKNYAIRKALIENPKTPLANSLRYLATLNEKDIAGYAKSKNISSVIATQAKRLVLAKKRN